MAGAGAVAGPGAGRIGLRGRRWRAPGDGAGPGGHRQCPSPGHRCRLPGAGQGRQRLRCGGGGVGGAVGGGADQFGPGWRRLLSAAPGRPGPRRVHRCARDRAGRGKQRALPHRRGQAGCFAGPGWRLGGGLSRPAGRAGPRGRKVRPAAPVRKPGPGHRPGPRRLPGLCPARTRLRGPARGDGALPGHPPGLPGRWRAAEGGTAVPATGPGAHPGVAGAGWVRRLLPRPGGEKAGGRRARRRRAVDRRRTGRLPGTRTRAAALQLPRLGSGDRAAAVLRWGGAGADDADAGRLGPGQT